MRRDNIDDIAYMILWSVSLDENRKVVAISNASAMNTAQVSHNDRSIFEKYDPGDLFVERAKDQIRKLDWSDHQAGAVDACAFSYQFKSDPDNPVSSNDLSR